MRTVVLKGAAAVDRAVALLCGAIVALSGSVLLGALAANVVARYLLGQGGFAWAQEVPEQLFPWFIAAGVVLAVQQGSHIAVDLLPRALGPRAQQALAVLVNLLIVVAYLWLTLLAIEVAEIAALQKSTLLRIPGSYGYLAIAAMGALTALSSATIALRIALEGVAAAPEARPGDTPA